jgi:hypothetical protein
MEIKYVVSLPQKEHTRIHGIHWLWIKKFQESGLLQRLILTLSIAFIFLILALVKLMEQVEVRVKAMPYFQIHTDSVYKNDLPFWVRSYTTEEIAPFSFSNSLNIFSSELTSVVKSAYLRNPWVEEVLEISKRYPNRIYITLSVRRPVAWIAHESACFLSDIHGVHLPTSGSCEDTGLPVITGVVGEVPIPGKRWESPSLQTALAIASLLVIREQNAALPIVEIRLVEMPHSPTARIFLMGTDPTIRILWGDSLEEKFPKVSCQDRLRALENLYQTIHHISGLELTEADIRFGYVILHTQDKREKRWKTSRNWRRL